MEKELQALIEKDSIIETITMLFIGTDNRDWPMVKGCFAKSVMFDMSSVGSGEPRTLGPQQIVEIWEKGLKPLKAIHHQAANFIVTIKDLKADVFCYGTACHYLPNPSGKNTRTFVGSYDFHLVKEGKFWRIDLIRFSLKFIEGNPDLETSK
jgi:hypothetical protein